MTRKLYRVFAALALLFLGHTAQAAITCSIGSTGFVSVYDSLAATDNLNQGSYTITCIRNLPSDPVTFNYITFTDDGLYNNGSNNRAFLSGASYIKYDFYTNSTYGTNWSKSNKCITGTVNFGGLSSVTQTKTYYSKVTAAQTGLPQGTYTDTVTIYASYNQTSCSNNASQDSSGSFTVSVSNVPACQVAIPPGDVAFTYTSYATSGVSASTTFQARCSTTLPYTMALDATSGTVLGLAYTLSLSGASGTGNGALQTYTINGTMAAGQSGICGSASCTAGDPRTLTITY
jgi:spore coat protein U-like protein